MARPLRVEFEGALYHLTGWGNARQRIFADEADCAKFVQLIVESLDRYDVALHGYVLMGNHYHLIPRVIDPTSAAGCIGSPRPTRFTSIDGSGVWPICFKGGISKLTQLARAQRKIRDPACEMVHHALRARLPDCQRLPARPRWFGGHPPGDTRAPGAR